MRIQFLALAFNLSISLALFSFGQSVQETSSSEDGAVLTAELPLLYDDLKKTVEAKKNAVLRTQNFMLQAESIIWEKNASLVLADQDVILTAPGVRLLCNSLKLNLKNGDYLALEVETGFYPWSFTAGSFTRTGKEVVASQIKLSQEYSEESKLSPTISFKELTFDQNNSHLQTSTGLMEVGNMPLSPIPPLSLNLGGNKRTWRFRAKAGKKANMGWYLGKRARWEVAKINTETEITGYFKRGILLSSKLNYESEEDPKNLPWVDTFVEFGWLNDQGSLGLDRRGLKLSDQRTFLDTQVIYIKEQGIRVAGEINYESDSEINRDLRIENFSNSQWNDYYFELGYEQHWGGFSGLQRWQVNEHEGVLERRPNLRLEMAPLTFPFESIHHSAVIEYSDLRSRNSNGEVIAESTKLDASIRTFRPFKITNGLIYTPSITARSQNYQVGDASPQATWTEWANELRLHLFANYEMSNKLWEIDGLHHSMDFILTHQHLELSSEKQSLLIPKLDSSEFRLNLEPLNIMDLIEADHLISSNAVRLDWIQNLTTNGDYGMRDLAYLKLTQDLWKESSDPQEDAESFYAQFDFAPARWLRLRGQTKTNDFEAGTINIYSALLNDGYENQYQISRIHFPNTNKQWSLSASRLIDYGKKLLFSLRYDSEQKTFPYWHLAFEIDSRNNFIYLLSLTERRGTTKEDEIELSFGFRLYSF